MDKSEVLEINRVVTKSKMNDNQNLSDYDYEKLGHYFSLEKKDSTVSYIETGKNYYPVSKMITTEAGIYHDWFKDIYITLGNEIDDVWFVKVYINPLVSFIWIGVFIMVFSGFVSIFKK